MTVTTRGLSLALELDARDKVPGSHLTRLALWQKTLGPNVPCTSNHLILQAWFALHHCMDSQLDLLQHGRGIPFLECKQKMREVALARTGCCHGHAPSSCNCLLQVGAHTGLSCPQGFQPCLQVSQGLRVQDPVS